MLTLLPKILNGAPGILSAGLAAFMAQFVLCAVMPVAHAQQPPLASWKDGPAKAAIMQFVAATTKQGGPDYVAPADRIATFDNDGTLWSEQPFYNQFAFALYRIKKLAPEHPEWKDTEPFKAVLENDLAAVIKSGREGIFKIAAASHAGMTSTEFAKIVDDWITTARHPATGRLYTEMVYQPMLELLDYLRANDFKIFIVSGGGIEFMRPWARRVYGIEPENVIGSSIKTKYEVRDGLPVIVRLPEINFIDDKGGKPVGISHYIGKRPILAFGNSDGDFEMLEWTTIVEGERKGKNLGLILHHDDAKREFAYDRNSQVGRLARGLDEGPKRGWVIVSMKNDWKEVFPAEK